MVPIKCICSWGHSYINESMLSENDRHAFHFVRMDYNSPLAER